jgi:TolB-like protein
MVRSRRGDDFQQPVPEELCRAHLNRILSSATFARAEQLRRLVEWLGYRSLGRNVSPPAEKEIGETVLKRQGFDPQTNSLVRKEVSRLRNKLAQYYAREGARERIQIHSAGGYLFRFVWWSQYSRADRSGEGAVPSLLVLPIRSQSGISGHAIRFSEEFLVRLGELGGAQLVSPTTALSYAGRIGDVREFAAECGADLVVEGRLEACGEHLRITLWLVDGRSGRTGRPGRFLGDNLDELVDQAADWVRLQYHLGQ